MDKEDFVNHIMYTSCERCPIRIYCSLKHTFYTTCEDVACRYYQERMVPDGKKKASNPKIRMV